MVEREYDPVLLGFIVDVNRRRLKSVKEAIISAICKMESDEMAYIYYPSHGDIPRWPGEAVASIANYKPVKVDLRHGIKRVLSLMAKEDEDAKRYLFVILDELSPIQDKLTRILEQNNIPIWERQNIGVRFCIFDGDMPNSTDVCKFFQADTENLGKFILNTYKEYHGRIGKTETSPRGEANAS